jgi:RHS repeat-associated protein
VGNRSSQTSSLGPLGSWSNTFDADDQPQAETYDAYGDAIWTGGKTYAYNSWLKLVSMNGGQVALRYDGLGELAAKTSGGVTTQYLVDDLSPTGYPQVVEELVGGAVTRTYTYGYERISQSQTLKNAWTPSFYIYDGQGTVRMLANLAGVVTDAYEYDAFGNLLAQTGTTPNVYLYRGERYDADLSLYYLRARWYNPVTNRFLSRDPKPGRIAIARDIHTGLDPLQIRKLFHQFLHPVTVEHDGKLGVFAVALAHQDHAFAIFAVPDPLAFFQACCAAGCRNVHGRAR